jgi:phospholipid transport system substrate-binding protein
VFSNILYQYSLLPKFEHLYIKNRNLEKYRRIPSNTAPISAHNQVASVKAVSWMTAIRNLVLTTLLSIFLCQPVFAAEKASPEVAKEFIQQLGNEAVQLLSNKQLPLAQREAKIRKLLRGNFDFKTIGQFVLGKSWRTASPEQRADYLSLFSEFVLRTYARRIGGYANDAFTITSATPLGRRDAIIVTAIAQPAGPAIRAGWRVRNNGGNDYKIIDVMVEKVSMAATQRSEYDAIVRQRGVDGLIEMLRAKVGSYSAQPS